MEYSQNYSGLTLYTRVPVTIWRMMKPSQNGLFLLKLNLHLKKVAKCVSGKYRPVSLMRELFLSLWNFRYRTRTVPWNSIPSMEQFPWSQMIDVEETTVQVEKKYCMDLNGSVFYFVNCDDLALSQNPLGSSFEHKNQKTSYRTLSTSYSRTTLL
jgi:hypothetical protein